MTTCANCEFQADEAFKFCPECGSQSVAEGGADPMIGRLLGRKYRVQSQLGSGSTGVVYLAEHVALRKQVAVKVLHKELQVGDEALQRFQREGIAAGQLNHPNVIQVFDFDKDEDADGDDVVFLAMEYVGGQSLKSWLAEHGPFDAAEAVDLARQLISTLHAAHSRGIVHRDLKPENLMLVEDDSGERSLKVLDFGLSKLVTRPVGLSLQTMAGRVLGTPLYMAPEQWRGEEVDHRADIYAASLILYELVAGEPPFRGSDITEVMVQTTSHVVPSLRETNLHNRIPDDLDEVVQRGLQKTREARFQTASEMMEALDGIRFDRVTRTRNAPRGGRGGRPRRASRSDHKTHSRALKVAASVGALTAVVACAWWWIGGASSSAADDGALVRLRAMDARNAAEQQYVTLLDEARERLRVRDAATAMVVVEKALRMPCVDAEAYLLRGHAYVQRDDTDTARADYSDALVRHPSYAEAVASLGWLSFEAGEATEALVEFERALRFDASCAAALTGEAAVRFGRGEFEPARTLLIEACRANGESARPHLWLGRVALAQSDPATAVPAFIEAKRRDSRDWQALEGLGDAYRAKGEVDAAAVQYREALTQVGGEVSVRRKLVELLIAAERTAEAEEVLRPALRDHARDGDLQVLAALVAETREDGAGAIEALRAALEHGVADPARVHELLGGLLLEQGNASHAVVQCEAAAELDDTRAGVHTTWGLALFRQGKHWLAAEKLSRAAELEPKNGFVHYTLGVIYMDYLEDPAQARSAFERYRDSGGADPRVEGWLRKLSG